MNNETLINTISFINILKEMNLEIIQKKEKKNTRQQIYTCTCILILEYIIVHLKILMEFRFFS